jgi:hypothetical protein
VTHEQTIHAAYEEWSRRDIEGLVARLEVFTERDYAVRAFQAT